MRNRPSLHQSNQKLKSSLMGNNPQPLVGLWLLAGKDADCASYLLMPSPVVLWDTDPLLIGGEQPQHGDRQGMEPTPKSSMRHIGNKLGRDVDIQKIGKEIVPPLSILLQTKPGGHL